MSYGSRMTALGPRWAALVMIAPLALACSKPKPPTVTPRSVEVTGTDAHGMAMTVVLVLANPSASALRTRDVTARVTLADGTSLGDVDVPQGYALPPNASTHIRVPLDLRWAGNGVGAASARGGALFSLVGTVGIEARNSSWTARVPFQVSGTLPERFTQAP